MEKKKHLKYVNKGGVFAKWFSRHEDDDIYETDVLPMDKTRFL